MPRPVIALALFLVAPASPAQDLTPLQRRVLPHLEQLLTTAESFEDDAVRLVFKAQVADALWDYDEPRARREFEDAFKGVSSAKAGEEEPAEKELSVFTQREVRSEILELIARRDSGLADRLAKSLEVPKGETKEESKQTPSDRFREAEHAEVYLRMALGLAETDPRRAVQLAKKSMDRGIISPLLLDVLEAIRAKKPALADSLFSYTLSVARRDPSSMSRNAVLLARYVFPHFSGGIHLGSLTDLARNSSASWAAITQLLDFVHEAALGQAAPPQPPELQPGPGGSGRIVDAGRMTELHILEQLLPYFDEFMPEASSDLRARRDERLEALAPQERDLVTKLGEQRTSRDLIREAEKAPAGMARDGLYVQAAIAAARQGDADQALSIAEKITHSEMKAAIVSSVRRERALAALKDNDPETAYRYIKDSPDLPQRAQVIGQIARALAKENKPRAFEILSEAEDRLSKAEQGLDKVRALLTLTAAAARLDPMRAFDPMRSTVASINQVEFSPRWDDERQSKRAGLRKLNFDEGGFPILGKADFERALAQAQEIRMPEASALSQLSICRGALRKQRADDQDGDTIAMVNGARISGAAIDLPITARLRELEQSLAAARREELDRQIRAALRKAEAKRRGISVMMLTEIEPEKLDQRLRQSARIEILVKDPAPAETVADRGRTVARVNGEPVTAAQIEDPLRPLVFEAQNQIYQLRSAALDRKISEMLQEQQTSRREATIEIFLEPPRPPIYAISTDDQPAKGKPTAPTTIVLFTDYECPSCARLQPILEKLTQNEDGTRLVVRDFPLEAHRGAFRAALAAEAAREQGKYWEYAALLYRNQFDLTAEKLEQYAGLLGLDGKKFREALDSAELAGRIELDIEEGRRNGVSAAPVVFVNGRRLPEKSSASPEALLTAITDSR